ncbi:uncharacterized protein BO87DRAFT_26730 [Aspergillus neoniger CBS 115656]|uniref:Uncharacterized protein n=1 Tax=Aspergillus neoniger (strain CBS 115656) TaxID=1448310 RepID=A0A318YLQ3_ASPNB|nr:hypothetical protein BO87DRAFT_26730 [Aspergillus neoniger CBS 115656]PYH35299.1 hypothetical protein BO87DRAFT_26730 [Aspergillus neoniger CBS 115656]
MRSLPDRSVDRDRSDSCMPARRTHPGFLELIHPMGPCLLLPHNLLTATQLLELSAETGPRWSDQARFSPACYDLLVPRTLATGLASPTATPPRSHGHSEENSYLVPGFDWN